MLYRDSELKGSVVRFRYGERFGFGNTPQGIIIKTAAFVPGVHDSVKHAEYLLVRAAAAMAAIGTGGFDLIAEKHKGSPHAHYTPEFALLPYVFTKTAILSRSAAYRSRQTLPSCRLNIPHAIRRPWRKRSGRRRKGHRSRGGKLPGSLHVDRRAGRGCRRSVRRRPSAKRNREGKRPIR